MSWGYIRDCPVRGISRIALFRLRRSGGAKRRSSSGSSIERLPFAVQYQEATSRCEVASCFADGAKLVDRSRDGGGPVAQTFTYDVLNRLTEVQIPDGTAGAGVLTGYVFAGTERVVTDE